MDNELKDTIYKFLDRYDEIYLIEWIGDGKTDFSRLDATECFVEDLIKFIRNEKMYSREETK